MTSSLLRSKRPPLCSVPARTQTLLCIHKIIFQVKQYKKNLKEVNQVRRARAQAQVTTSVKYNIECFDKLVIKNNLRPCMKLLWTLIRMLVAVRSTRNT